MFWHFGRAIVLVATVAIVVGLIFWPQVALPLLWDLLIPILPATFFLTPQLWRGVCPLATVNQWTGGRLRRGQLQGKLLTAANLVGIVLLTVMVATRRLVFNEYGIVLAITILAVIGLAALLGSVFNVRAGFCNSICPVLPIERIYGQHPLIELDNHRCEPCTQCIPKGCLEVSQPKSLKFAVRNAFGKFGWVVTSYGILAASLPGFIIGYFTVKDVLWSDAGAPGDAATVYMWIGGCSFLSYLTTLVVVFSLRLSGDLAMAILGALAGTLYYWWAAPLIVRTLQLPPIAAWPLRLAVYALLAVWFVHAIRKQTSHRRSVAME